jgi:pilus assembly protein CpaB
MMAVTINFCLSEEVAGAVQAGSEVAVFDTIAAGGGGQITAQPGCAGAHEQANGSIRTRVVLSRVQVLSVGTAQAGGQTGTTGTTAFGGGGSSTAPGQDSTLVTLAVSQAEAEQLIQLTETGLPYLALLTQSSKTQSDAGSLTAAANPSRAAGHSVTHTLTLPTLRVPAGGASPTTKSSHYRTK